MRKTPLLEDERSARLFNRRPGRLAGFVCCNRQHFLELTAPKNLDLVEGPPNEPGREQHFCADFGPLIEGIKTYQVHNRKLNLKLGVIKAALRDSANKGHLTSFKPESDASTRPGLLAFVSLTGGLAVTAAFAAP